MGQDNLEESSVLDTQKAVSDNRRDAHSHMTVRRPKQTLSYLYGKFRKLGLSKLDSAFNALYICQTNKYTSKKIDVKNVGDGFFEHPVGWYSEKEERIRRSSSAGVLKTLEFMAKVMAPFSRSVERVGTRLGFFFDNSSITLSSAKKSFKKMLPTVLAVICSVILVVTVYIDAEKETVVEFSINGVTLGEVSSVKTVDEALLRVTSELSSITGEAFSFPYDVSYKLKNKIDPKCLDVNTVYELLYPYTDGYTVEGYGLYIDSRLIAVLDNRDDIVDVLETVKNEHMKLTGEQESIANRVDIKYQEFSPNMLISKDELLSMFTVQTTELVEEERVTSALLAAPTSLTTLSIDDATPEIKERIYQALENDSDKAIQLDYEVYYQETVREAVPYDTQYIYDDTCYQGQEIIQVYGRTGLADNKYKVRYVNGEEADRQIISQTFIRNPRTEVVKVGTRVLPETLSEEEHGGKYMINPVPTAVVSDHFGWRVLRGRSDFHEALDLAAWVGTPIYATASGEVIYSGYNQSYGYVIKIRHEDGLVTLYAHCSELLVETGDYVKQADKIALVGSTGDSTGYHLHLELIKDGEKIDPELYIYSLD